MSTTLLRPMLGCTAYSTTDKPRASGGRRTMRLFSYKLTHDTGFAPNPFWGYLTLATCKPWMRRSKLPGDWVAGFTSKALCNDRVGDERLVFLMQVDEKLPLADYFSDPRFQSKIPRSHPAATVYRCGDNIYRPLVPNAYDPRQFEQLPNDYHVESDRDHDLKGRNALIAKRFAYFSGNALSIPAEIRPDVPAGQSSHGTETRDPDRVRNFIDFVFRVADAPLVHHPYQWPSNDTSWKTHDAEAPEQNLTETERGSKRNGGRAPSLAGRTLCQRSYPEVEKVHGSSPKRSCR